jgi:hypothetical protein
MSESLPLETEVSRGIDARHIIEHYLFKEAVEVIQADIYDKFCSVEPTDPDGLVYQRIRQKCFAEFVRHFQTVMETGKLAEEQIIREKTLAQRAVDRLKKGIRSVV